MENIRKDRNNGWKHLLQHYFKKNAGVNQDHSKSPEKHERKKQMLVVFSSILAVVLAVWFFDKYLNTDSVKVFDSLRDELLAFLEIVALSLLIIVIVTIVRWILRNPEGIVILPFEMVIPNDKDKPSLYNGKSLADSLTADIINVRNIHENRNESIYKEIHKKTAQNNLKSSKKGKFASSQFKSIGEDLNVGFADIANISVSGNSISIGKILLTLKKLWNDRDPKYIISGSFQKYGTETRLVSRLKAIDEKDIIILEVHSNIETEDEIPELIRDLAFNIWQNIPNGWTDISSTKSKTWLGLKYFTEALNCYDLFCISGLAEHLDKASAFCLKASQQEIGYKNLYNLAFRLGEEKYNLNNLEEYAKAQKLFECAANIAYDAFAATSVDFKIKAANAHNAYGSCCLYQQNYPDAEHNFRKAKELMPNDLSGYYNLILVLADLNRIEEARDIINEVVKLKIINKEHYNTTLGDWFNVIGLRTEAIEKYKTAIEEEPNNIKLYNKCGKIYSILEGQDVEAIASFKKVLEKDPEYSDEFGNPHNDIGAIYFKMNLPKEALAEFQLSLHQNPAFADPHFNLGNIYSFDSKLKDSAKAIREYQIALQLNPNLLDAYYNLGLTYGNEKEYDNALYNFQQAIAMEPNNDYFHNSLASTLFALDRFDDAENEYKNALKINPDNFDSHAGLGYLYRIKEDYPKAIRAFRHATRLKEKNSVILKGMGEVLRRLKSWDEAIYIYKQVIRIEDMDPYGYICLALCHSAVGEMEISDREKETAKSLRKIWETNPYTLACYESLCGNPLLAIESLRIALNLKMQTIKYISLDIDLDPIRNEPEFKRLMEGYAPY